MNKILVALLITIGFSFSTVQAAGKAVSGKVTTGDCALLSGDTALNTSKDVKASVSCVEATNSISFGTCHPSGSRAEKTYKCALVSGSEANGDAKYNDASCNKDNVGTGEFKITADYKAFLVGNQGGSVGPAALKGTCDDGKLGALLP